MQPVGVVLDMDGVIRQMDEIASTATTAALDALNLSLDFTTETREELRKKLGHSRRENLQALYALAMSKTTITEMLEKPNLAVAMQELVKEYQATPEDLDEMERVFAQNFELPENLGSVEWIEGQKDALLRLAGMQDVDVIGVTNTTGSFCHQWLRKNGFNMPVLGREHVTRIKPHSDGILRAIMELTSQNMLEYVFVVGDYVTDILATRQAQRDLAHLPIVSVAVLTGGKPLDVFLENPPDYLFNDLGEFVSWLRGATPVKAIPTESKVVTKASETVRTKLA